VPYRPPAPGADSWPLLERVPQRHGIDPIATSAIRCPSRPSRAPTWMGMWRSPGVRGWVLVAAATQPRSQLCQGLGMGHGE
jgi:hypothetical protein